MHGSDTWPLLRCTRSYCQMKDASAIKMPAGKCSGIIMVCVLVGTRLFSVLSGFELLRAGPSVAASYV